MKIGAIGIALAITLLLAFYVYFNTRPLEQQIMAADSMEFIGELPMPDGGSELFYFRLPHHQSFEMLIRHRRADFGANPDFQEIWLDRSGMNSHIDLQVGSELEKKLIILLRIAKCNTSAGPKYLTAPSSERLKWALERIQDRKAPW